MKKIISIAVCFVILLSCVLPVQASGGVPEKVMESTKSVVRILSKYYSGSATGSGFVIKNEPGEVLIATNDHVVSGNPYSISVWVGENELVDAEIVFTTSAKDLCVLRVTDPIDMKPLTLSTEDPQHGAAIYVVGYPGAGDILSDTQAHTSDSVTITDGIISAIRTFTIENGAAPVKLLQVNAAINSGNSGGPLLNSKGEVIGINTYKVNADSQGVFGSVSVSELLGLLDKYNIEIPVISKVHFYSMPVIAGAAALLLVIFIIARRKKRCQKKESSKKSKTQENAVSLTAYMQQYPHGLGVNGAVSLLLSAAIQLRNLHNDGKLHLQIYPENILIDANGASIKEPSNQEARRYNSGFAAPEIYKGAGFGVTSDIYSFAAVLYYTATGTAPANSLQSGLLEMEINLFENNTVFAETVSKCMAELQQDRIQSMQELISGISAFSIQISNPEFQASETKPINISKETKRRKPTRKLIPLSAMVLCVIVTALLWKPYIQPEISARKEAFHVKKDTNQPISNTIPEATVPEILQIPAEDALSRDWQKIIVSDPNYHIFDHLGEIDYVIFLNTLQEIPELTWDVSMKQDGSILAWAKRRKLQQGSQIYLYFAAEGGVNAPSDSSNLFADKSGNFAPEMIDFNDAFHTGNVTNMSRMFYNCLARNIDVSCFDTGNVTDMSSMFCYCENLERLDMSDFDTSNVTDMSNMLWHCGQWNSFWVGNLDTSNVTNYKNFMETGRKINGQPWEKLFDN